MSLLLGNTSAWWLRMPLSLIIFPTQQQMSETAQPKPFSAPQDQPCNRAPMIKLPLKNTNTQRHTDVKKGKRKKIPAWGHFPVNPWPTRLSKGTILFLDYWLHGFASLSEQTCLDLNETATSENIPMLLLQIRENWRKLIQRFIQMQMVMPGCSGKSA